MMNQRVIQRMMKMVNKRMEIIINRTRITKKTLMRMKIVLMTKGYQYQRELNIQMQMREMILRIN
jgi:hypothetical protein